MTNDPLNQAILRQKLNTHTDGMQITVLKECPSTNGLARELAIQHPELTALTVAESQTNGRGRLGRSFHSPTGTGVYFSVLYPWNTPLQSALGLTCAASVAVMRAILHTTGIQTQIKWVNDLLLNEKKVCGILTEAVTIGEQTSLIIGIGINLRPMEFPTDLCRIAGTLNQPTLSRADLIAEILNQLLPMLHSPRDKGWLADYRRHSCVLGKEIMQIENGIAVPCIAEEIDGEGRLSVRYADGSRGRLQSGEISIRLQN